MKKLAVTLSLLAVAAGAFAQGSIQVNNTTASVFRTNSVALGGTAGNALSSTGPGFYYEVLTAPSTVTSVDASLQNLLSAPWSDTAMLAVNGALAGRMSSATTGVQNWAPGIAQSYIIVGWSGSLGTTWASLSAKLAGASLTGGAWSGGGLNGQNGWLGATVVGWRQAGGVVGSITYPTPLIFGTVDDAQGTTIKGPTDLFVVGAIPEPSSMALIGLGIAAGAIFRRRK